MSYGENREENGAKSLKSPRRKVIVLAWPPRVQVSRLYIFGLLNNRDLWKRKSNMKSMSCSCDKYLREIISKEVRFGFVSGIGASLARSIAVGLR